MTYVALAPLTRERRLAAASERLERVGRAHPDLLPAVALQERLILILIEAAEVIETGRLPRLSLPPRYLAAKLRRGVPIFAAEPIPVPGPVLTPFLLRICREVETGGAGASALHIRTALEESRLEPGLLLSASLERNQQAIRAGALHLGLAPDLLWLVAELAVSPFIHALRNAVLSGTAIGHGPLSDALTAWPLGFCPACGSWPALGEIENGHRVLRCSFCTAAWEMAHRLCPYCSSAIEVQHPLNQLPDFGVDLCRHCSGYLKTVNVTSLSPFPLLATTDLETMDVDVAAMQDGFGRPALRESKASTSTPSA